MHYELRHLRYFLAVAEERSFTRAAERLHIAQPPLSRQIQQLEEVLETVLFVRGTRPLEMTEAGRFLYEHAVPLIAQADELGKMTRRLGKLEQKLSLGFVPSTLFGLLPEMVRRFKAANPALEVSLHEMTTVEQFEALKAGIIDIGIGRVRREDPKIRRIVLRHEALIAAVPADHSLAAREPVKLRDLLDENLLVYPRSPRPSYADQVLDGFKDRGLTPYRVQETRDLQVTLLLVAAGVGVAVVPAGVRGMQRSDIVFVSLDEPGFTSPVIMSTRIYDESQAILSFREVAYGVYRSLGIAYVSPNGDGESTPP